MKKLLIIFCFLPGSLCYAQDPVVDSLKLALKNAKHDTTRCRTLAELAEVAPDGEWQEFNTQLKNLSESRLKSASIPAEQKAYKKCLADALNNMGYMCSIKGDFKGAVEFYNQSLKLNIETNDKPSTAVSYNNIATTYLATGDVEKALEYHEKSLKIKEELGDKKGISTSYNNIGLIHYKQGNIPKALDYYMKSLRIDEENGYKKGMASALLRIAMVYESQTEYEKAKEFMSRSLNAAEESGDKYMLAQTLNNFGVLYEDLKDTTKALEYYDRSLDVQQKAGDKFGEAASYHRIGLIWLNRHANEKALNYFRKSLEIKEVLGDKEGISWSLNYIGVAYRQKGDLQKALEYGTKAMKLAQELGFTDATGDAAWLLFKTNKDLGRDKEALKNYELYITMHDSIANKENQKAALQSQFKYEYEKKAAADSVRVEEEKKVVAAQLQQEKTQRFALYGGLALVLIFAIFMFNRFRVTSRQKTIIEAKEKETSEQKHIIEEKQKEIVDSINYAKRLQDAILPPPEFINQHLPSSFILYKPKDIVAGDFYWAEKEGDLFFIAAADSTGHGVPGAMVSVVCSNALNRTVKEFKITETGKILDKTRELVIDTFAKSQSEVKDGMDISLLCIDTKNKAIYWSGANNPLWYVLQDQLVEIKPDKQPIGKTDDVKPFTTHHIDYKEGTTFFLFTDGFADQFGGPQGKKFKYKPFGELLLSNNGSNLQQQRDLIEKTFMNWKGNLEQVDDVCVIGIRI